MSRNRLACKIRTWNRKTFFSFLLIVIAIAYHAFWYMTERGGSGKRVDPAAATARSASRFVANFFDTLGIGSFATTTSMSKLWKVMPDEKIPGTLNVGYVLATVVQAVIFMTIIEVDFMTLVEHYRGGGPGRVPGSRLRLRDSPDGRCKSGWALRCLALRH